MIAIGEKRPEIGQKCRCKVTDYRYGIKGREYIEEAEYIGWNEIVDQPMFEIETNDEYYAEVTAWEPI